jgi:hypothetical protein
MSAPTPPPMPGGSPPVGAYPSGATASQPDAYESSRSAAPADADPYDVHGVSVGDLIGNVTRDLSTLLRQELALAQAELKQEASKTAKGAGAMAGAGAAGYFVLLFLSLALWAGLSNVMDAGWAALIVAVIWAVIAAVLFATGRKKLREVNPTPERTVETLSQVPDALKGSQGGTP